MTSMIMAVGLCVDYDGQVQVGAFQFIGFCSCPRVCSPGVLLITFAERNELQKDIEQLCMQQAGPAYLGVATRMHFQRWNRGNMFIRVIGFKIKSLSMCLILCS